ncbi:PD-(D/E)XK nuclease-like domain-containing protein [Sphingopyxis sp.]|uniref:PD-(D/E)XK nuclease-like domain-containing protein n=1 Tax=Sphingopyxis sp. TaxID=1908224 RepID=UPI00403556C5
MKPGVYLDLSNDEYHNGDGINKGLLDVVDRSPMHARALLDYANDNDREPTTAMVIGTALHTLVLEPEKFAELYVGELTQADAPDAIADRDTLISMVEELNADRLPKLSTGGTKEEQVARIIGALGEMRMDTDIDALAQMKGADLKAFLDRLNADRPGKLNTGGSMSELAAILADEGRPVTLWKDVRARWAAENEGFTVLSPDDLAQLHAMRDAIRAHPAAGVLLDGEGVAEASVYWTDEATGELCRCRPDRWRKDGILVDLKSTLDASPEGFAKSLANYRYHVQAPWYLGGARAAYEAGQLPDDWQAPRAFAFIAVEKSAPYAVAVYTLDAATMELGAAQMRANLDTLAECRRTGVWPGYGDKIANLSLPDWYLRQKAELLGGSA